MARIKSTGKFETSSGLTVAGSFASLPSSGNTILVWLWCFGSALDRPSAGVTDNQGNTYVRDAYSTNTSNLSCAIYRCQSIGSPSGTFTVTVEVDFSGIIVAVATEFSDVYSSPLDQVTSNNGTGTAVSTGATSTLAQAAELIAACCVIDAAQASITVESLSPAWVEEAEELTFTYEPGEADSRIVSSTAAVTGNWTAASSGAWRAVIATYKVNGGGGGPVPFPWPQYQQAKGRLVAVVASGFRPPNN